CQRELLRECRCRCDPPGYRLRAGRDSKELEPVRTLTRMNLKILLLPGDGIGTEVTSAAVGVLSAVAKKFGHTLELSEGLLGGIAIHKTGTPFPKETEALAVAADATL